VTLYDAVAATVPERSGMQQGWSAMLDRLAGVVTKG
jgi:hypothetical protein